MTNWRDILGKVEEVGKSCDNDYATEEAIAAVKWMQANEDMICPVRAGLNNFGMFSFEWDLDIVWEGKYCNLLIAFIPKPSVIMFAAICQNNESIIKRKFYR